MFDSYNYEPFDDKEQKVKMKEGQKEKFASTQEVMFKIYDN